MMKRMNKLSCIACLALLSFGFVSISFGMNSEKSLKRRRKEKDTSGMKKRKIFRPFAPEEYGSRFEKTEVSKEKKTKTTTLFDDRGDDGSIRCKETRDQKTEKIIKIDTYEDGEKIISQRFNGETGTVTQSITYLSPAKSKKKRQVFKCDPGTGRRIYSEIFNHSDECVGREEYNNLTGELETKYIFDPKTQQITQKFTYDPNTGRRKYSEIFNHSGQRVKKKEYSELTDEVETKYIFDPRTQQVTQKKCYIPKLLRGLLGLKFDFFRIDDPIE